MAQKTDAALESTVAGELRFGDGLTDWPRRLAGLVTLCVLAAWINGSARAADEVGKAVLMQKISAFMEMNQAVQMPLEEHSVSTTEQAADMLKERARRRVEANKQRRQQGVQMRQDIVTESKVQGVTTASWMVIMVLTGAVLLGAALAGLAGSDKTRRWHGTAAKWILCSTVCTAAGIYVLSQWGGFPMPHYGDLAVRLGWQVAYGVLIIVCLMLPKAPDEPRGHDLIEARLKAAAGPLQPGSQMMPPPIPRSATSRLVRIGDRPMMPPPGQQPPPPPPLES